MSQGSCQLQGVVVMPRTALYDRETEGSPIARLGGEVPVTVTGFPKQGSGGRARIETGTGRGSFRLSGYMDAAKVPVFTERDVPVVAGHLWIGTGQQVVVLRSSGGQLRVSKTLTSPIDQTFTGSAPCSSFTLTQGTPPGWNVPGGARGYVLKQPSVDLYDGWTDDRNPVTTLRRSSSGNGILLWGIERHGGWVHVVYHADVIIDAWAPAKELHPLPPGETMDQQAGSVTQPGSPRLAPAASMQLVKTSKAVRIRLNAKDDDPTIGYIEPDTDTYVVDTMAGWSSVIPKALNVLPYGDGHFWVKSSDLGS
jgi:hypothetical protein